MAIRLLYHDPKSTNEKSPFDDAIRSIAREGELRLACPYLSLDYLKQVIDRTTWRLLTDVEEWLRTQSLTQRNQIVEFLSDHHDRVKHYSELHAKVIVGLRSAIFGSANFTNKGIWQRAEVSAVIDDVPQIEELTRWFDACWNRAQDLPSRDAIESYINALPEKPAGAESNSPKLFPPLAEPPSPAEATLQVGTSETDPQQETQVTESSPEEDEDDVVFSHVRPSSAVKVSATKVRSSKQDVVRRYLFRVIRIGRTAQPKDIPFLHALAAKTMSHSTREFGPNAGEGRDPNERRIREAVRLALKVSEISLPTLREIAREVRLNKWSNKPEYSEDHDDEVRKELGVK